MGLDRRILQITFNIPGKPNTFEGKDAKTPQRPSEQAQSSAKPRGERLLLSERSSRVSAASAKEVMYEILDYIGGLQGSSRAISFYCSRLAFDVTTQIGFQIIIVQQRMGDIDGLIVNS